MQVFFCDLCKKEMRLIDSKYEVAICTRVPVTENLFYEREVCKDCAAMIANYANSLREERK